jgi:riboflavin kinase / FMN adenylyltransferase
MELIRGFHNLQACHSGCVASIGNFDGMHLGHQQVLVRLHDVAEQMQLPAIVILFEPQPKEYFQGDQAPTRLMSLREKLIALQTTRVARVLCLSFNRSLAALPAEDFIATLLVQGLGVKHLIVGDDFRFGHKRIGDYRLLQQAGKKNGFTVESIATISYQQQRISSTWVRQLLAENNFATVAHLLGRPYSIAGRVMHGDGRGHDFGFPTANIRLQRRKSSVRGVYAVTISGLEEGLLYGAANVGHRPTVDGQYELLEVFIFAFNRNIYGRFITVNFVEKLRDEEKFASLDLMLQQITRDVAQAKTVLSRIMN